MNDDSSKPGPDRRDPVDEIAGFFRRLQWALLLLGVGALISPLVVAQVPLTAL